MDYCSERQSDYRGCTDSRLKKVKVPGASDIENYVYEHECKLGLHKIYFETFDGAIVRHGYKQDLNNEHLKSIARQI